MKFLKALVVFILVIDSLGSAFLYPVVYLDFSLRRDYIAKVLCINREKPITVCGGQCYLSDQLRKVRDQEEQDKENTSSSIQFVFFYQPSQSIEFITRCVIEVETGDGQKAEGTPVQFATDIFHPPSQA